MEAVLLNSADRTDHGFLWYQSMADGRRTQCGVCDGARWSDHHDSSQIAADDVGVAEVRSAGRQVMPVKVIRNSSVHIRWVRGCSGEPATGRHGNPMASAGDRWCTDAEDPPSVGMDSQIMLNYLLFICCTSVSVQLKGNNNNSSLGPACIYLFYNC